MPPGRRGPDDDPGAGLFGPPPRVLLESMVASALWPAVAFTGPAARLIRCVVLEVALDGGPPTGRPRAGRVPDLGQVPQPDPRIVPLGLVPVITLADGDRPERHDQVPLFRTAGMQPPGPVAAGLAPRCSPWRLQTTRGYPGSCHGR